MNAIALEKGKGKESTEMYNVWGSSELFVAGLRVLVRHEQCENDKYRCCYYEKIKDEKCEQKRFENLWF